MIPKLYDPAKNGENYDPKLVEFAEAGKKAKLTQAATDKVKTMLLIVDMQRDFVHTDGALSVPGALGDVERLIDWIYKNAHGISAIGASLDTHTKMQIFHSAWWRDGSGKHPDPFTVITYEDIVKGKWMALKSLKWSIHYVKQLEDAAKKNLMVWPDHCLAGTDGQKLVPALAEAIAYHSAARDTQPKFLEKGTVPQVEHYGIFAAEVPYPKNPKASGLNTEYLDLIAQYDRIYVAGEAKSHCVLETMRQMLNYFASQPEVIAKIRFLVDCTSSVVHPAIDFEAIAKDELAEMEKQGVQMIESTKEVL